jgi:hypothetical protein
MVKALARHDQYCGESLPRVRNNELVVNFQYERSNAYPNLPSASRWWLVEHLALHGFMGMAINRSLLSRHLRH